MARRKSKPAVSKPSKEPNVPDPREVRRKVGLILGGFVLAALAIIVVSWPSYQVRRHTMLADRALQQENYAAAIGPLEYLVEKFPEAWRRMKQLGTAYLETNNAEKALANFRRSLAINPNQNLDAEMGRAYYLLGDRQKAFEHFESALERDFNDARAHFYLALLYMDQADYQQAAHHFQAASHNESLFERSKPYLEEIRSKVLGDAAPPLPAGG